MAGSGDEEAGPHPAMKEERRKTVRRSFKFKVSSSMFTCLLVYLFPYLLKCALSCLVNDPALEENVDQKDGQECEDRSSEDKPLICRVLRLKPNKEKLDGSILGRGEDDERPEVIVPGCHEGENAERGERRHR